MNLTLSQEAEEPLEWSPDNQQILFVSKRSGNLDVFKMDANGGNVLNLSNRSGNDGADGVHWMHGGADVLFAAGHVWTMSSTGANPLDLTGTTQSQGQPVWAAMTDKIYYVNNPSAGAQIFVMNANGTNQHSVTDTSGNLEPVPSPDGLMIAWSSTRDGNSEIYVANADGSNPTRVTNNSAVDSSPRWRPCP